MNRSYLKPLIAGVVAGVAEHYLLGQSFVQNNFYFGASVAIGTWLSQLIAPAVVSMVPQIGSDTLMNTKTVAVRLSEIGLGAGSSYAVNKFILKNDFSRSMDETNRKIGVIALSDFVSEYATDFIFGSELNYLTSPVN
jgi:phage shock protein PspC (stress-responsive transcriptional regulator)